MESILIHPENAAQLKTVKAVLMAFKVPFEPRPVVLPSLVSASIKKSLKQFEAGDTILLEEFKEKHFSKNEFQALRFIPEAEETYEAVVWQLRQKGC